MARELRGNLQGTGLRVAIVVARFNQFVTQKLLEGALDALSSHGVNDDGVTVAWVPGSFELPLTAKTLAGTGSYDAVVCLGAVIRGETTHYDMVAGQAASGISRAALDTEVCARVTAAAEAAAAAGPPDPELIHDMMFSGQQP